MDWHEASLHDFQNPLLTLTRSACFLKSGPFPCLQSQEFPPWCLWCLCRPCSPAVKPPLPGLASQNRAREGRACGWQLSWELKSPIATLFVSAPVFPQTWTALLYLLLGWLAYLVRNSFYFRILFSTEMVSQGSVRNSSQPLLASSDQLKRHCLNT